MNVAIYVRLSDEDRDKLQKEDESESIQNQKSMLRDYCKERNWTIYDIYNDENFSGIDSTRPEFNRMINDCQKGNIDIVLCKSQSRFSRDAVLIETYLHNKFIEWGIRFIGVVDHADTNDKNNKKSRQILALTNEWYVEEVSENIRRTLKHKREQGQFTGSFAPYGYLVDPKNKNHLIIDEEAAPIVRDIFNWYAEGWGYRKITMELNGKGIPSPSKHKELLNSNFRNPHEIKSYNKDLWTYTTIYTIVRNEIYTGTLVQGKSHNVSYKNKKRLRVPEDEWIKVYNTHEPIVDMDMWNRVKARVESRQRVQKTTNRISPLSGKVKCAVCGKAMKRNVYYNKKRTIQYYGLQCATYKIGAMNCPNTHTISGLNLEKEILSQLNELIAKFNNQDKIEIQDEAQINIQRCAADIAKISKQISEKEIKLERLYEDKLDGIISKEQFISFNQKISEEISRLKESMAFIETEKKQYQLSCQDSKRIEEAIKKYSQIDVLTKEIVDEFIKTVYVGEKVEGQKRKVTIEWKF
ncbi:MAG: recombinase family protein [Ruminococcus sp.]|nr:recombinase family protein [Ruminococcus sp.]MCM1478768.1 recombinase family protein [Muribaculaceae bacterium]